MRSSKGPWGEWLTGQMRVCGFGSDDALAQAIGVAGTTVHRWRKGAHPEVTQLRQLVEPLRTDLRTLLVVSGTLTERELGGRAGRTDPLTAREVLENDQTLSAEARQILLAAYDTATAVPEQARRSRRIQASSDRSDDSLRAVARGGKPEDREEVRRLARKARDQHDNGGPDQ